MKIIRTLLPLICSLLLLYACKNAGAGAGPDYVLYNAVVVPMTDSGTTYQAIAIKDGKILQLGSNDSIRKLTQTGTKEIDCQGKTIMPGFIDAHAHIGLNASLSFAAKLEGSPYGDVNTIKAIQDTMRAYISRNYHDDTSYILGNGYDDATLEGHKQPTKEDLDAISTTHPIYLFHSSGHMGVANSALLKAMGITDTTSNPPGGIIVKENGKVTGLLMENANINALMFMMPHFGITAEEMMKSLIASEKLWFSYGITTICEGRASPETIELIKSACDKDLVKGDYIVLPDFDQNEKLLDSLKQYYGNYQHHFKIGAVKFTFDGSPQGRSAALTKPYLHHPIGQDATYKGELIYPRDKAGQYLAEVFSKGMQVHIHCNGDAAIDEGLELLDSLYKLGKIPKGAINVMVHTQVCRPDQVDKLAAAKSYLMPSWFPTHTYIWGDWHRDTTLGLERASHISPLKAGLDKNILFTIHTDAPVTPPDLLTAVYAAVNRRTLFSKTVLGPEQCISPWEAMKAITVNGAIQWGEEKSGKGKLVADGIADIVILSDNPLTVAKETLNKIKVLSTYKNGKPVYGADAFVKK
ncbi:amidohydrolase [Chitinophaga sp. Hz27]|uniref:amidohydrolase n=1 Tax=Chitinophaga sp. Hz27 TaxID=3347169 RepID=UPI0035DD0FFB